MDMMRLKEINDKIIDKAAMKVEMSINKGDFDCECFEVLSDAINTKHKLHSIEKEGKAKEYKAMSMDNKRKTEFEEYVWKIMNKGEYDLHDIMVILSEHMEDIKILQPRFYDKVMMKLKELCK